MVFHKTNQKPFICFNKPLIWVTLMQCSILVFAIFKEMVFHKTNQKPLICFKKQLLLETLVECSILLIVT